jgi:hypothetical protein
MENEIAEQTEPKRTIFESIGDFNFYGNVERVIRFNSYFSKLGFERVNTNKEFGIHTFYPQLTLMINPTLVLQNDSSFVANEDFNTFTKFSIQRREPTFDLWDRYFYGKEGYLGLRSHHIIKQSKEEVKPLKIEFEGKELMLGQYLKERNIVMLYINPFNTDYSVENNKYLELVLKLFEGKMNNIKLEKVDVAEKMKLAFIEKFKSEINDKLSEVRNGLKYNEDEINNLQSNLIKTIRNATLNRKQIEGLIAFSTNTDDTIKKAIEEVKQLPFVKNIRLTGSGIGLDVGSIKIKYKDEEVYIGDFYLIISPDGIKVYCKNPILNNENIEISHPHIDGNNNCYGGERENKIIEYLSTFDLKKLVFFVYMFLKTYTSGDSYNNLDMWCREDLQRRKTREIKNEEDISSADFQGDYFQERRDRGTEDNHFGDNNEEDEEDENNDGDNDYVGDCDNCGDNIYSNDNDSYINNDDGLFCCDECVSNYRNRDREQ